MARVAVIGGGLAGLAAAHRLVELDPRLEVTIFEASDRLGGAIATSELEGYLVEHGADMFISDKPAGVKLCERLGIADRLIAPTEGGRRSLVLRDGRPVEVPEGFALMAPTRLAPMLMTPILSPLGKLRMAADVVLPRGQGSDDESLASFVRRRLGSQALDRLVQPLVGGIWTGDPERLSLRATLPRFLEMERAHRSLIVGGLFAAKRRGESGARYGLFVSFPRGMRELLEALTTALEGHAAIRMGAPVTAIDRSGEGYALRCPDEERAADAVILALPAHRAAPLIESIAAAAAGPLAAIPYASSAIVVSGHRLADVRHSLDAFGLVIPAIERRRILAVSFASRKLPGRAPAGRVLLRTFVGGATQPELFFRSDDELLDLVRAELSELLGVGGEPDFARVFRHARAMPQYEIGHLDRVATIERVLANTPSLAVCGNAFRGVGIPDTIASAEAAAERVARAIGSHRAAA
jgi:protoporphyrinogen/coproporphyrinogen III oxidase